MLYKSESRGDKWKIISPDLTKKYSNWIDGSISKTSLTPGYSGAETAGTIRTISESPLNQGMLWVGTDDGNVQITMDNGLHWTNLTDNIQDLPKDTWVSHIYSSKYSEGRAYATFDGHRMNDFNTYVYVTEDYGKTWTKINGNLPVKESCYVIKEGLKNPDLLFLGTEFSLWISLDRGKTWTRYQTGDFPTVAIYDLEIQPREMDLIIGTHGRSIWILPIGALEELTNENREKDVYFVKPSTAYFLGSIASWPFAERDANVSKNTQPGTQFFYYLKEDAKKNEATITVTDAGEKTVYGNKAVMQIKGSAKAGLNVIDWNTFIINRNWPIKNAGNYRVILTIDNKEYYQTLQVEDLADNFHPGAPAREMSQENDILKQEKEP